MPKFIEVTGLTGRKNTIPVDKIFSIEQKPDNTAFINMWQVKYKILGYSTKESYEEVIAKLSE